MISIIFQKMKIQVKKETLLWTNHVYVKFIIEEEK